MRPNRSIIDPMTRRSPLITRALVIRRVEAQLRSNSFPRLQMMLLVALTGGIGLLVSSSMLRLGLDSMAIRYPLALALSYLFFLFLLGCGCGPRRTTSDGIVIPGTAGHGGDVEAQLARPVSVSAWCFATRRRG